MRTLWFFLGILTGVLGSYFMTRKGLSVRMRWITLSTVVAAGLITVGVRHEYTHWTPERAQAVVNPNVGPFEKTPFAKGVVLLTPSDGGGFIDAWYMEKGFWGWHVVLISEAALSLSPQNYNVDFEPFTEHGQTFVWGTVMLRLNKSSSITMAKRTLAMQRSLSPGT